MDREQEIERLAQTPVLEYFEAYRVRVALRVKPCEAIED
jgi:hypothetical protein